MKSFKEYIFELNDDTYLRAAKARKAQGKEYKNLLDHSDKVGTKKFIDDLKSFDWWDKYVVKEKSTNWQIYFTEEMHTTSSNFDKALYDRITNDISDTCSKHGKLIQFCRFLCHYGNEEPHVSITFLNRKKVIDIKDSQTLYHVTLKRENAESIIKTGLKTESETAKTFVNSKYKCVFAFTKKKGIKLYLDQFYSLPRGGYYVIEFKPGDNLYFDDVTQNFDLARHTYFREDFTGVAVYTLDDIPAENIVSVKRCVSGNKVKEVLYDVSENKEE
jgi:hypothetical protein